ARGADEVEDALEVALEVIEKDPADAARLVAVCEEEVAVALVFHLAVIDERNVLLADALPRLVKRDDVFAEGVIRREVGPAAEPGAVALGQVAEVGVYRRHQRAARVQHERDAGRGEAIALARYLLGELRRHLAENFGEIDASLLEDRALDHDARASAPAA